jgi:LytTr DNA-binding domain
MGRKRKIVLYAAGWLLTVGCVALNTFLSHRIGGHEISASKAIVRALAFCMFWIISLPVLWRLGERFPLTRENWIRPLAIHLLAAVLVGALLVPFRIALDLLPGVGMLPREALFTYYAATLPARSVILYAVFLAASQAALFYGDSLRHAKLAADLRDKVAELIENASGKDRAFHESFTLRESGRIFALPVEQIDWIEAAGNYVSLHVNGRTHLLRETMNAIESKLDPERFVRVQRSAIVQVDRVQELRIIGGGRLAVVLRPGAEIVLGRAGKQKLESLIPQLRLDTARATSSHV